MGNRIVIVDDDEKILDELVRTARKAGCEVLRIHFDRKMTIPNAAQVIKSFDPHNVFINHIGGGLLAHELRFPKEKFIGTSDSYFQDYCARTFQGKYCINENSVKAQFLELCRTPL